MRTGPGGVGAAWARGLTVPVSLRLGDMFWPMLAIAVGFLGLAVLGVLAVRVFLEAQRLGRQVSDSASRINRAAEELERASASAARSAGGL
ncbi:hypothetical protein GCM10010344_29200 [Streptomyces bluensis]|nr:hypothetical protein GCM10010344_29200 [Streptomyces bluensis]